MEFKHHPSVNNHKKGWAKNLILPTNQFKIIFSLFSVQLDFPKFKEVKGVLSYELISKEFFRYLSRLRRENDNEVLQLFEVCFLVL